MRRALLVFHLLAIGLCLSAPLARAGNAADVSLLLHPEKAFVTSSTATANFAVSVDGKPLSYDAPQVLFEKTGGDADFIAGAWKDSAGKIIHQREVLIVKPDYGIVVDHLYGSQEHEVSRTVELAVLDIKSERNIAYASLKNGEKFTIQALRPPESRGNLFISGAADKRCLSETCRLTLPSPFTSVFFPCAQTPAAPKIEFVKPANPMIVKCKVTFSGGRVDEVGIAWESRELHLGGKAFKGWAAVFRQGPGTAGNIEIK